jgi:peptide/nickel transport system substrate-binding protein
MSKKEIAVLVAVLVLTIASMNLISTTKAKQEIVFITATDQGPDTWNPNIKLDIAAIEEIAADCYSKLVKINPGTMTIIPDIAASWEISPDMKTYTFNLRHGVKWHDGVEFTSADVKWTIDAVIRDNGFQAPSLKAAGIINVETPDAYTVVFNLNRTYNTFLWDLAGLYSGPVMLAKHVFEGTDWKAGNNSGNNGNPIGTGAFKYFEDVKGDHWTVVKNDDFYLEGPYIDKVTYKITPYLPTEVPLLKAGEIDSTYELAGAISDLTDLIGQPGISIVNYRVSPIQIAAQMNLRRAPFNNTNFRMAMAYAINRDDISKRVYLGGCPSTDVYVVNGSYYNPNAKNPPYNTTKAEELLDAAGYPKGSDGWRAGAEFELISFRTMGTFDVTQVIKEQLAKVGVQVDVVGLDDVTAKARSRAGNFDMTIQGGYCGPHFSALAPHVVTGGARNFMNYSNPEVDALFAKASSSTNETEIRESYYRIQEILLEDMPRLALVDYRLAVAYRADRWKGLFFFPEMMNKYWEWQHFTAQSLSVAQENGTPLIPTEYLIAIVVAVVAVAVASGLVLIRRAHRKK